MRQQSECLPPPHLPFFPSFSSAVPKVPVNSRGSNMLPATHLSTPPYIDVCLSIHKFTVCGCTCVIDLSAHERCAGKTQTNSGTREPHLAAAVRPVTSPRLVPHSRSWPAGVTPRGSLARVAGLLAGGVGLPCQTHTSTRKAGPRVQINTHLKQTHSQRERHTHTHTQLLACLNFLTS